MSGEVSFAVRPSLGARKGWKIMPEAGGDAIEDPDAPPYNDANIPEYVRELYEQGRTVCIPHRKGWAEVVDPSCLG